MLVITIISIYIYIFVVNILLCVLICVGAFILKGESNVIEGSVEEEARAAQLLPLAVW